MRIVRSGFNPTHLVGIWRGGAPIGITVQEVLEFHGLECDHLAIRTSSYTGIDQHVRATDEWLVFPHELRGLTREEILSHKPVDASFFDATPVAPDKAPR